MVIPRQQKSQSQNENCRIGLIDSESVYEYVLITRYLAYKKQEAVSSGSLKNQVRVHKL